MDDHDRWIRNLVYRRFIELGRRRRSPS